jgi:hypothetical protein
MALVKPVLTRNISSLSAEVNGHDRNNLAETDTTSADAHIAAAAAAENGIS